MSEISEQIGSSVNALMREFDVIAHNLANVSTAGYKRRTNTFSKSLEARQVDTEDYSAGSVDVSSVLDFSQGNLVQTGRSLDFALCGRGFFVIETPDGPLYTRNGVFHSNENGQIVNSEGRIVAGQSGVITIPPSAGLSQLHVSGDGSISAGDIPVGKFRIVDFQDDQSRLVSVGANCYRMTDESVRAAAAENVVVKQGFQEASNVKIVEELVDMIMVCRLYEANMKFVSAQKDTSNSILNVAMG